MEAMKSMDKQPQAANFKRKRSARPTFLKSQRSERSGMALVTYGMKSAMRTTSAQNDEIKWVTNQTRASNTHTRTTQTCTKTNGGAIWAPTNTTTRCDALPDRPHLGARRSRVLYISGKAYRHEQARILTSLYGRRGWTVCRKTPTCNLITSG